MHLKAMKKTDKQLGMEKTISRRDFVEGVSLASVGLTFGTQVFSKENHANGF